jgi:hypothetical protein
LRKTATKLYIILTRLGTEKITRGHGWQDVLSSKVENFLRVRDDVRLERITWPSLRYMYDKLELTESHVVILVRKLV